MLDSFDPELVPTVKLILHVAQICLAFAAWCLEISVFRNADSSIVGSNGWAFAVVFLSIPAWIYLGMAPRFARTRKIAEPHAMAVVDGLFTILWLSAFAAQATYNTANLCGGACGQSKAIVGLGFFVCLLFGMTTFISLYTVFYFRQNGQLPGYGKVQIKNQNIDPDKAAFSMAPHDEEAYSHVPMTDHNNDHDEEPEFNAGPGGYGRQSHSGHDDDLVYTNDNNNHRNSSYGRPSRGGYQDGPTPPQAENPFESPAEYPSYGTGGSRYNPPTAQSAYDDDHSSAHFPAGNYDRVQ